MSSLSPKQDLLLSSDHHKILPWPSLGPDDGDFNPDQYLNDPDDVDAGMIIGADDLLASGASDPFSTTVDDSLSHLDPLPPPAAPPATTQAGPVTPGDGTEHPSQTHQSSPASGTDPATTLSPTLQEADRSSSLSPVPDADQQPAEQQSQPQGAGAAPGAEQPRREEEEEEDTHHNANNSLSRLSTPLSPLSPPPQEEEEEELAASNQDSSSSEQKKNGEGSGRHMGQDGSQANDGSRSLAASTSTNTNMSHGNSNQSSTNGLDNARLQSQHQQGEHGGALNGVMGHPGMDPTSGMVGGGNMPAGARRQSGGPGSLSASTSSLSAGASSGSAVATRDGSGLEGADPKAAILLELNAELLRICMMFQAKGVPTNDPLVQQYSTRLQLNLAWGAASVDQPAPGHHPRDPPLEPPPPLDFVSTDRIRQLYADLASAFAKEHARRQQLALMNAPHPTAQVPNQHGAGVIPPGGMLKANSAGLAVNTAVSNLKRERPEEQAGDAVGNISKRRDLGDQKMMPPPTSIPINAGQPGLQNLTANVNNQAGHMAPTMNGGVNNAGQNAQAQQHMTNAGNMPMSAPQASAAIQPQNLAMQTPAQSNAPQSRPPSQQSARQGSAQPQESASSSPSSMMNMNPNDAVIQQARQAQQAKLRAQQQQAAVNARPMPDQMQPNQQQQFTQQQLQQMRQQQLQQLQMQQQQQQQQGQQGQQQGMAGQQGTPNAGISLANLPPQLQQAYQILQTPNHPLLQQMLARMPNFKSLPVMAQLQRMHQLQAFLQKQNQDTQQQNAMAAAARQGALAGGNPMQNPLAGAMGGGGMQGAVGGSGNMVAPSSPVTSQSGGTMFTNQVQGISGGSMGGGAGTMDPRMLSGSMQAGPSGMNLTNMSPQQRQLFLMQQQARMGGGAASLGGAGAGGMNMNQTNMGQFTPQQQQQLQQHQQERMRQMQLQERMAQQAQLQNMAMQNMNASGHGNAGMVQQGMMGGGGGGAGGMGDFSPAGLRQNPQVQSISRGAWSPTGDGTSTPSPMTPRIGGGNVNVPGNPQMGMSREEYQRLMMQQQQMQASRTMTSSPAFGVQGQKQWSQQQQQQAQQQNQGGMMMGMGGGMGMNQQGGSNYGMSPPGSAGGMSGSVAPSPPNSAQQNWAGGAGGGGYGFGGMGGGGGQGMDGMRHMSGTPGPQQHQQQQAMHGQMAGMVGDAGSIPNDFDLFAWNG